MNNIFTEAYGGEFSPCGNAFCCEEGVYLEKTNWSCVYKNPNEIVFFCFGDGFVHVFDYKTRKIKIVHFDNPIYQILLPRKDGNIENIEMFERETLKIVSQYL